MKSSYLGFSEFACCLRTLALGALCVCADNGLFAAGLSVSLSSITNDYSGDLGFLITAITSSATVRLEEFLDLNNNGAIDSTDLLVNSYLLTDGQATSFGGVRDTLIPGDDDSVPSQITSR